MRPIVLRPRIVLALCALLVAVTAACTRLSWSLWSELETNRARLSALRSRIAESARSPSKPAPHTDFTVQWPAGRVDDEVLDQAVRDAQRIGVRVATATASMHPDSKDLVQQFQFNIEVRGTYANIKTWLTEVMARRSGLAIDSLDVRGVEAMSSSGLAAQQEVVAAVRLRLFMRPKGER